MKKYPCHECGAEFQAETRKEMLNHLYEHYMKEHHAIITGADEAKKKRWVEEFNKDWSAS